MAEHESEHGERQRRLPVTAAVRRDAHDRALAQPRVLAWAEGTGHVHMQMHHASCIMHHASWHVGWDGMGGAQP